MSYREAVIGASKYRPVGNMNVYDYFLLNTKQYGDYTLFGHKGKDHLRSEFINDIEATACYFKNELKLKQGDVFTIFLPTSIEAMIIFMALNKLGVTVSILLPHLPIDSLNDALNLTLSKGIAYQETIGKEYLALAAKKGLPVVICCAETYAVDNKFSVKPSAETLDMINSTGVKYAVYSDIIEKYNGQTTEGVKKNSAQIAVYMNGGGTTGQSRTIKLSNFALNSCVFMVGLNDEKPQRPGVDTDIGCMPFFHAYGFCVGGLTALHRATKLVLMPAFNAEQFIDIMKHNEVIQFCGVPKMYKKLFETPGFDGPHLKYIRTIFSGGDDLDPDFLAKFNAVLEKNGAVGRLQQGYGLTECCAICISNPVYTNKDGTIGRPLNGLLAEIWDENNNALDDNQVGEIVLSGPSIMEGYLTKDGPIDEGLYTDEFGRKWVKTGDLAYRDEEGFYYFMGRKKRLIIIAGYNVYPKDVENLMAKYAGFISECCAVQGFDEKGNILVRLYVVLTEEAKKGDKEAYKQQIIDICKQKLAKFSVPRDVRFIDALPRTKTAKVDFIKMTQQTPDAEIYNG